MYKIYWIFSLSIVWHLKTLPCISRPHLLLEGWSKLQLLLFKFSSSQLVFILPSIAQLVERRTVVGKDAGILRSLVRLRLEGIFWKFSILWIFLFIFFWHGFVWRSNILSLMSIYEGSKDSVQKSQCYAPLCAFSILKTNSAI